MSWTRPTLAELIERITSDLSSRLLDGVSVLTRSVLGVLARVFAGAVHLLHGFLSWSHKQHFVHLCESEYLDAHASTWGLTRTAAAYASGGVEFAGEDGSVVPSGTELSRSDGALYTLSADVTIASGSGSGVVAAQEAGADGDAEEGTTLSLVSAVDGVSVSATVGDGGLSGGLDEEADAGLRARVLARIQEPPHGGAAHDYVAWALEISGVSAAWCYPLYLGAGTVGVTFVVEDGPIPGTDKVAEVQAHIDEMRPVTAEVTVFAPVPVGVDFEISGLVPDTSAVRAAVETELAALIEREAEPAGAIPLSHVREAVSAAAGEEDHTLVSPASDVVMGAGEYPVMGTVTWS